MDTKELITVERLKRDTKALRQQCRVLRNATLIFMSLTLVLIIAGVTLGIIHSNKFDDLNSQIQLLEETNETIMTDNTSFLEEAETNAASYDELVELLTAVSGLAVELDESNIALYSSLEEVQEELSMYREREELYDSYEWALYNDMGKRTDITYDNITTLKSLVADHGLHEDVVDLILAIVMVESSGNANCKNPTSTATGLGQFLSSTGKWVYTELMDNDVTYVHSEIATDAATNLEMMVYYLEYLADSNNGNVNRVINNYRGLDSSAYKNKINSYLANNEKSLGSITLR